MTPARQKSRWLASSPSLLETPHEWVGFLLVVLFVLVVSLAFEYRGFLALKKNPTANITAQVLLQYQKSDENGTRTVLKLKSSDGFSLYVTTKERLRDLQFRYVRVRIVTKNIVFSDYLTSFYAPMLWLSLIRERDYRGGVREFLDSQHDSSLAGNLYRTLYLADPLDKSLREGAMALGISHIIAISGFHLGVLGAMLWGIAWIPYRYFQRRFFPYRNLYYDLGALTLVFAALYLVVLDFSASFLRAFAMATWSYFLLHRGISVLSFNTLFSTGIVLVALSPRLLFSIGFFLSMMGVFLIFLYLHHVKNLNKYLSAIFLNINLYFCMLIPAHAIFSPFSPLQLLSIPLSIIFVAFYPLSLLLHALGLGGAIDSLLLPLLLGDYRIVSLHAPYWLWGVYGLLAIFAIRFRTFYIALNMLSVGFFLYGIYLFL